MSELSRRQRLLTYAETGRLRDALERGAPKMDSDAVDLIVDIVLRYCSPRRKRERA